MSFNQRSKFHQKCADSIMRSKIYRQGGSFTLSDLPGKLRTTSEEIQRVLDGMVDDGQLMETTRSMGGNSLEVRAYASMAATNRMLLRRRLAYYSPPTPERIKHYNEWMRTIAAYELNNV